MTKATLIDAIAAKAEIKKVDAEKALNADIDAITSNGYEFDEYNNPIKSAFIIKCSGGEELFDRVY